MNRRDLLTTLPALAVAAPSAAIAQEPETEIMRLFGEWKTAVQRNRDMNAKSAEIPDFEVKSDKLLDEIFEIEKVILATPCQSPRDFVAKVASWTGFGEMGLPSKDDNAALWAEADKLIGVPA